jgi:hypothetical protein
VSVRSVGSIPPTALNHAELSEPTFPPRRVMTALVLRVRHAHI